jgi:hypothetical protein
MLKQWTVELVETPAGNGFAVFDEKRRQVAFIAWGGSLTMVEAMELAHTIAASRGEMPGDKHPLPPH